MPRKIKPNKVKSFLQLAVRGSSQNLADETVNWGSGRYQLLKTVGKGAMGVVFLAFDRKKKREVALKILNISHSYPKAEEIQRFKREICSLSQLSHSHIIRFFDAGEEIYQGTRVPFYTMEYSNSRPLSQFLQQQCSPNWAISITEKIADGLSYIHGHNIVHRDLKPANIIIEPPCFPKILDFGLAKILEESETFSISWSKMLLGTPEYMAPEQFHSPLQANRQSDIYSLGAILYHLLTGKLLISLPEDYRLADDPLNNLHQVFLAAPKIDFSCYRHLDKDLENICSKALAQKPQDRYSQVEIFAKDLSAYCNTREKWHFHFLLFSQQSHLVTGKTLIGKTNQGEIVIVDKSEVIYAEIILVLFCCQIYISQDLYINGQSYPSGANAQLFDGDCIEIESTAFYYRKAPDKDFY